MSDVFDALREGWDIPRYRYGLVLPVLTVTTVLGVLLWLDGQFWMSLLVLTAPFLSIMLVAVVAIWVDWLDG